MTEHKHTPGPWAVFINDCGDAWTGWPLSIYAINNEDKTVVRPGGQWPYEWDAAMSQREAVANAHLIAAAPDMLESLKNLRACIMETRGPDAYAAVNAADAAIAKAKGQEAK